MPISNNKFIDSNQISSHLAKINMHIKLSDLMSYGAF